SAHTATIRVYKILLLDALPIFVRDVRYTKQLFERNFTERQLDADHLYPWLTLAVDPSGEPQAAEFLFCDSAFAKRPDFSVELDDFFFDNRIFQFSPKALHGCYLAM